MTSSDIRTQSICVLFSPSVYYRNSQVINSIFRIFLFLELMKWRRFVTYLWNDPRNNNQICMAQVCGMTLEVLDGQL